METTWKDPVRKIVTLITFIVMLAVNALANSLPLNGVTTGQVSEAYPNLFVPAGFTFTIWGAIYLLLILFVLYDLGLYQDTKSPERTKLLYDIGWLFSLSSLANAAWVFAWHYEQIELSLVLIIVMLLCLKRIQRRIAQEKLSLQDKRFIGIPFSIYLGWVTVATVANVTVLLVSWGWNGFGISGTAWTVIVLLLVLLIVLFRMIRTADSAYGVAVAWAYYGILSKHLSPRGFDAQHPMVIVAAGVSLAVLVLALAYVMIKKKRT